MRHIYAGFLALLPCIVFAKSNSLTIQPRYTTSYRFTATEVWNIDLQFSGLKPVQVYLQAKITSSAGGKSIADLTSVNFMLNPGMQSYTSVTLGTAQLQYISREVADIESLTGSFPAGNYKVCYWARCVSPDCNGNGADAVYNETPECFELVVEPPTPLLLAFPEDKSEIEMTRPTFNWVPPIPIASVQGFNYLYTLVEKRKNQSCPDAILTNRPLYKQNGVEMPVLPYPPEINDLDTCKTYCWKVDGLVGDIPVAQSEVWEFKVKKDTIPPKKQPDQSYIEITNQDGNAVFYTSGKIKLKYSSRTGNRALSYSITKGNKSKAVRKDKELVVQSGENYYDINLDDFAHFRNGETLQIAISDQGKVYVLKYIFQKTK